MENQTGGKEPLSQAKTPQQEADALIEELTHPPDPNAPGPEEMQTPGERAFSAIKTGIKLMFNWLVTPAAIVLVLNFFVFQAFQVEGSSMEPTLHGSDYLIISKVSASLAKVKKTPYIPKRDDIVVFIYPLNHQQTFVKRVVGVPGDRVVVKDGRITVFNKQNPDGFNPDASHKVSTPITLGNDDKVVPEGSIYVVGDNRLPGASWDSRNWGLLPSRDIIGVAVLRLLPISGFRLLSIQFSTL